MKKIHSIIIAAIALCTGMVSCSDVEYEAALYSEPVSNLTAQTSNGSRKVTLTWDNPSAAGQTGVQIIKDNTDITNINEVINSYFIRRAPVNTDVAYTIKAVYDDGRISEGQTVRFNIDYSFVPSPNRKVAILLPAGELSDDEAAAKAWFEATYSGNGVVLTSDNIDDLDIEDISMLWVMCDRNGINHGYGNLPGGLASAEVINALKSFCTDGGNMLLTNHATQLVVPVGRIVEAYAPGIFGSGDGGNNGDTWGLQAVIGSDVDQVYDHRSHPIYKGLSNGEYGYGHDIFPLIGNGWKEDHNCMWDLNAYGLRDSYGDQPNVVRAWETATKSTVLGTWQHVVDYCCAAVIDFEPTADFKGRIVAVGPAAYEWNQDNGANSFQSNIELMTKNAIEYLK